MALFWSLCRVDDSSSTALKVELEEVVTERAEQAAAEQVVTLNVRGQKSEAAAEQTVTLNVRGQKFEVLPSVLKTPFAKPTLLEELVQDRRQPCVFVDASPERFTYILDWYRDEEVHLPPTVPVQAFLKDAAYFRLPDFVKVNGSMWPLPEVGPQRDAHALCREAWSSIKDNWPQFEQFLDGVIGMVQQQLGDRTQHAGSMTCDVALVEAPFTSRLPLSTPTGLGSTEHRWKDEKNVCSKERLNVLVSAIQERGFTCEVDPLKKRVDGTVKPLELKVGLPARVGSKGSSSSVSTASSVTPFASTASQR